MTTTRAERRGWDVHAHLVPEGMVRAARDLGAFGMQVRTKTLMIKGAPIGLDPMGDPSRLLARLDNDELAGAVVSAPPPLFRPDLSEADAPRYADLLNATLLEACAADGARLKPLAYLPAERPGLAAEIATALDHRWAGAVCGTELSGRVFSERAYDVLWRALSIRGLPLFIHPGSSPDSRLDPFYLANLLGNPFETTLAAAHLIFGGAIENFPELTIILAHGGGALAALVGRWARGVETKRPTLPPLRLTPVEAARRFYVDGIVHSLPHERLLIETLGEDQILFGSDWPFPMGVAGAPTSFEETQRSRMRNENVRGAFGRRLDPTPP